MRLHLFFLFFSCLDFIVASAWTEVLRWGLMRLDLFMPALCWYGLVSDFWDGICTVIIVGIFMDAASGVHFGLYSSVLPVVYCLVRYLGQNVQMELWWQRAGLVILVSFVVQFVLRIFTGYLDTVWPWGAIQSITDGALAICLFPMLSSLPIREKAEKNG